MHRWSGCGWLAVSISIAILRIVLDCYELPRLVTFPSHRSGTVRRRLISAIVSTLKKTIPSTSSHRRICRILLVYTVQVELSRPIHFSRRNEIVADDAIWTSNFNANGLWARSIDHAVQWCLDPRPTSKFVVCDRCSSMPKIVATVWWRRRRYPQVESWCQ